MSELVYVQRDEQNNITGFSRYPNATCTEAVQEDSPELQAFLHPPQRRPRQLANLIADIQALSAADRNKLTMATLAGFLQNHPGLARSVGISLDGDEPVV